MVRIVPISYEKSFIDNSITCVTVLLESKSDIKIGELAYSIYGDQLSVDSIEIYSKYRGHGYGKAVVHQLVAEYDIVVITGDSRHEAVGFWKSLGALFKDIGYDTEFELFVCDLN